MRNQVLVAKVVSRQSNIIKQLQNSSYLFADSAFKFPKPRINPKTGYCSFYIPKEDGVLALADKLGFISGSFTYRPDGLGIQLVKYSYVFKHNNTLIQVIEDEESDPDMYSFRYERDIDNQKPITHPEKHLQFAPFDSPRFAIDCGDNEIDVFIEFLEFVRATFYKGNKPAPNRKRKLERKFEFLSHHR